MPFAGYQNATKCTGSAPAGSRALMKFLLDTVPGSRNLGIYNCRSVRGGGARSLHSEGRALDLGMPMSGGKGSAAGRALVEKIRLVADQLGVQCIIYDRRIWSAKSPGKNGRAYGGVNPHYDHLHIELTKSAAAGLTVARARSILGGKAPAEPKPTPKPSTGLGARTLRKGMEGDDVAHVQAFIGASKCGPADGIFGAKTDAGVRWYQDMRGLDVDGIVGDVTWSHILGKAS